MGYGYDYACEMFNNIDMIPPIEILGTKAASEVENEASEKAVREAFANMEKNFFGGSKSSEGSDGKDNSNVIPFRKKERKMLNREDMPELSGRMTPESNPVISLGKVIDAIEMADDLWNQYFDLEKKEVVSVPSDISMNGEVDEDDQEIMEMIEEGWQVRFFGLPSKYDIHEYSIMERFIWELPTDDVQNELERAIRGRGAFRRFKDTLRRFNMEDKWYEYEAQAYRKIAIEWCENNGFEYEE